MSLLDVLPGLLADCEAELEDTARRLKQDGRAVMQDGSAQPLYVRRMALGHLIGRVSMARELLPTADPLPDPPMTPPTVELLRRADQLLCGYAAHLGIKAAGEAYPARAVRTPEAMEADDVIQQIRVILRQHLPNEYW